MGIIALNDIMEGMILSADVRDVSSRLLLPKGETLKPEHKRILKIWGICEISIEGDCGRKEPSEYIPDPEFIEKVRKNTEFAFRYVDLENPGIKELFRLSVIYRSRHNILINEKIEVLNENKEKRPQIKKDVRSKIEKKKIKLPEIPSIVFKLNEIIATPFASATDIANIVNKSPSLAAVLLRIVNSAFYGFPSKIDNISRAVALIGSKEITHLAIGVSIMDLFKDIPRDIMDMYSFLKHSLACGIISRILASRKNIENTEYFFVSGLLHDIGRLILFKYFPDHIKMLLAVARDSGKPLYQLEKDYLGCRHTDIAKYLLKKWKLPFSLENNIVFHHSPLSAHYPESAAIVHLADIMASGLGLGGSGDVFVPSLDNRAWELIKISPGIFEFIEEQAIHQLSALEPLFTGMKSGQY